MVRVLPVRRPPKAGFLIMWLILKFISCREFIFTEPEIIGTPSLDPKDQCFHLVAQVNFYYWLKFCLVVEKSNDRLSLSHLDKFSNILPITVNLP